MDELSVGDVVFWKWIHGFAEGTVIDIKPERTQIVSKNKLITRNGTKHNPAIVIQHKNGNEVIKLLSQLQKV